MSLTLTRMRYLVRKGLGGLDSTDLNNEDVDELLNLALWELTNNYPFELKETLFTTTLVESQNEYQLMSGLDGLFSVAVIDSEDQRIKLDRMTRDWYDLNYDGSTDAEGTPVKYMREGTFLILDPSPDADAAGLTLSVTVIQDVDSLVDPTNVTTGLPRNWDELVVKGAISKGHFFNEDYNLARESHNFVVSGVRAAVPTVAKEERDARHAGLDVMWDWPE